MTSVELPLQPSPEEIFANENSAVTRRNTAKKDHNDARATLAEKRSAKDTARMNYDDLSLRCSDMFHHIRREKWLDARDEFYAAVRDEARYDDRASNAEINLNTVFAASRNYFLENQEAIIDLAIQTALADGIEVHL